MDYQNNRFIKPANCGSSIGYYITTNDWTDKKTGKTAYSLSATVVLADCNHKIDWSFELGDVDKIDDAIAMLQEFRKKYVATEKMIISLNK